MDYQTLSSAGEFVSNHPKLFIAGGVLAGCYALNKLYQITRPVIEGIVIEGEFSEKEKSRVKLRTLDGDFSLIFDTVPFESGIKSHTEYCGKAKELETMLPRGARVKVKVAERKGLERTVHEVLNISTK